MSRKKISEFRAKSLILNTLGRQYQGISIDLTRYTKGQNVGLLDTKRYVVKVDQAIKRRNQQNLVSLNLSRKEVAQELLRFKKEGYSWALVEDFYPHARKNELFLVLEREEEGVVVTFSEKGGVEIEKYPEKLKRITTKNGEVAGFGLGENLDAFLRALFGVFEATHMTYLEINPLVVKGEEIAILDAAVEVDTAAQFFVKGAWTEADFREPKAKKHDSERAIEELAATSPSSLVLKVLNDHGSIFLLLSGGGASVVVADEFANLGYHEAIGNYGEYSGNPTEEETYVYAKQVIKLLINSRAPSKKLIIAGGIANFTDVAKTFKGLIRAIEDDKDELIRQKVQIFVRRGGPNQQAGLDQMKDFLDNAGIKNKVSGSELSLAAIVHDAVKGLK